MLNRFKRLALACLLVGLTFAGGSAALGATGIADGDPGENVTDASVLVADADTVNGPDADNTVDGAASSDGQTPPGDIVVTPSNLHHFEVMPIADQLVGVPFFVTVVAVDANGVQVDFNGKVDLGATDGATPDPLHVKLTQGTLTFQLLFKAASLSTRLTASFTDVDGLKTGKSNAFSVQQPPAAMVEALLISNPVALPGDTVWFRGVVTDKNGNPVGGVALELYDEQNQLVQISPSPAITTTAGVVEIAFPAPPKFGKLTYQLRVASSNISDDAVFFVATAHRIEKGYHGNEVVPAPAFTTVAEPFSVIVTNLLGQAVKDRIVIFTLEGEGSLGSAPGQKVLEVLTSVEGYAAVQLTTGLAGQVKITAKLKNFLGDGEVSWTVAVVGDLELVIVAGDGQSATVESTFSTALKVLVRQRDSLLPSVGVQVNFRIVDDTGTISGNFQPNNNDPAVGVAKTDTDGHASVTLTLGTKAGAFKVRAFLDEATFVDFDLVALPGSVDLSSSSVTLEPAQLVVNQGHATLTIGLEDIHGNPLTQPPSVSVSPLDAVVEKQPLANVGPGLYTATYGCVREQPLVAVSVFVGALKMQTLHLSCVADNSQVDVVTPDAADGDVDDPETIVPDLESPDALPDSEDVAESDVFVAPDLTSVDADDATPGEDLTGIDADGLAPGEDSGADQEDASADQLGNPDLDTSLASETSPVGNDLLSPADAVADGNDLSGSSSPVLGTTRSPSYVGGGGCAASPWSRSAGNTAVALLFMMAFLCRRRRRAAV